MKKLLLIFLLLASSLYADAFDKGNVGIGIIVGSGSITSNNEQKNYTIFGANVNYFIENGLSLGVSYTSWTGNSPSINEFAFPLTYYFDFDDTYRPYLGIFYKYTSIGSPYSNYSSYGGRAGLTAKISKNAYIGAGVVQEYYSDCSNFKECSSTYPEILVIFTF